MYIYILYHSKALGPSKGDVKSIEIEDERLTWARKSNI